MSDREKNRGTDRGWSIDSFASTEIETSGERRRTRGRALAVLAAIAGILLLLLIGAVAWLSGSDQPEPAESGIFTENVVVVGLPGRTGFSPADRAVIDAHADATQVGVVASPGSCPAAGWAGLGAGARVPAAGCEVRVGEGRVTNFDELNGPARGGLGRLGEVYDGCITAVGPAAAVAAADRTGQLEGYAEPGAWLSQGMPTSCPLTLVDAGPESDRVVADLARRPDLTVIAFGLPGSGAEYQPVYRVNTTLPGVLEPAVAGGDPGVIDFTVLADAVAGRPILVAERDAVTGADAEAVFRDASGGLPAAMWAIPLVALVGLGVWLGLRARAASRRDRGR